MLLMLLWWIYLACGARRAPEVSELDLELALVDVDFADRQDPASLDSALNRALGLLADRPDDPQVLLRVSQILNARSLTQERDSTRMGDLEASRSYGLRCLLQNGSYSSRVDAGAGRITTYAAQGLGSADLPCMEQTVWAWIRWVELRGPAGEVDLVPISRLTSQIQELSPQGWTGPWAQGMILVLPIAGRVGDLDVSRELLAQAIAREPRLAEIHWDFVQHQLAKEADPSAVFEAWSGFEGQHPLRADGPWALENQAARAEARATTASALIDASWR